MNKIKLAAGILLIAATSCSPKIVPGDSTTMSSPSMNSSSTQNGAGSPAAAGVDQNNTISIDAKNANIQDVKPASR